jgi:hypothetical protein
MMKTLEQWDESEQDETWKSVVDRLYKEVIRQFKQEHHQRLPWEETTEEEEQEGGSKK